MTHKLATWFDQFGSSGCVGCGRCITWCPVGIDITEEVAAIRATEEAMRLRRARAPCSPAWRALALIAGCARRAQRRASACAARASRPTASS